MIEIKLVTPKGFASLQQLPESIKDSLVQGMKDALLLIERTSKTKYLSGPYPSRLSVDKGVLRASLETSAARSNVPGEIVRGIVGIPINRQQTDLFYAKIQTEGKIIHAKSPKGMHFLWKRRNIWVHGARTVTIPPRPFLWPAVVENLDKVRILLQRVLSQSLRKAKTGP